MQRLALVLLLLAALVVVAPSFAPLDPMTTRPEAALHPPGSAHWFGTDRLGRDLFSRTLHGGQRTLLIAAASTATAVLLGVLLGTLAAIERRLVARVVTALINALLAFPGLLLALVVLTLLGGGAVSLALATGIALLAPYARLTRGAIISARSASYVEAARALGASEFHILTRHVLPTIAPTLLAYGGVTFSYSLLNNAALSFLGLSGDLGVPDWGTMLYEGRLTLRVAPWVGLAPGLAITAIVWCVNDAVDRVNARRF